MALKVDGDPLLADAAWAGAKRNMLIKPEVETDQRKKISVTAHHL